jgi:hypothetical protein
LPVKNGNFSSSHRISPSFPVYAFVRAPLRTSLIRSSKLFDAMDGVTVNIVTHKKALRLIFIFFQKFKKLSQKNHIKYE